MEQKPKYIYEIGIPVIELFVYRVEANTFSEAMKKIENKEAKPLHSAQSGFTSRVPKLLRPRRKIKRPGG